MTDVNPYSAPNIPNEIELGKEFRSLRLARVLLWLIRGRDKKAKFHRDSGEFEMFQAAWLRWLPPILIFLASTFLLAVSLSTPPPDNVILFGGAGFAVLLGVFCHLCREAVYFTESYVRRFGPFRMKTQLAWDQIESVTTGTGADIVLRGEGNRSIWIHAI